MIHYIMIADTDDSASYIAFKMLNT